ncbi:DinB family protein [Williamsia maris]|uniref:DinB superfamily protein n=1 Tax=Williamsia maris TaxID=72806 RepID=A0ABT1HF63_9NOCA|nr:DinB family protein [Williamsia maris]MCP2175605.1 DinB superfamily protein [Williamsia maris]
MPIEPETKSWTWVLEKPCDACGLDASQVDFRDIPDLIIANAAQWSDALDLGDPRLRPNDSTWSPLEYAAHVRDVFRRFATRIDLMITEDDPEFENWDQDATAVTDRYNEQDPATVLRELASEGATLAEVFRSVPDDALGRSGRRSDGSTFTVETLGQYFIHDPVHHLFDVTGQRFPSTVP